MPVISALGKLRPEDLKFVSALCNKSLSQRKRKEGRQAGWLSKQQNGALFLGSQPQCGMNVLLGGRHFQECPVWQYQ